MVTPSSSLGQPSWVQPIIIQNSLGYTYIGNQPAIVNQNYQPTMLGVVYLDMPYLRNMYTPWGQPN